MAPGELALLYDAHAPALYAYLLNLTRSEADAQDLLQDLFVRLASRAVLPPHLTDPRGYLLRLAHNLTVDAIRSRESRRRSHDGLAASLESAFAPSPSASDQALQASIAAALADLPVDQRAVVHLKLWEGRTFETIAELLDIPANTAASRYRYAMEKLRDRLRPLYQEIL